MKYISSHLITSWGIVFSLLVNKACIRRSGRRERLTWSCTITQERVEGLMAAARQQEEGGARCRQRACQARAPPRALRRPDSKREQGRAGTCESRASASASDGALLDCSREHAELEGHIGHFRDLIQMGGAACQAASALVRKGRDGLTRSSGGGDEGEGAA